MLKEIGMNGQRKHAMFLEQLLAAGALAVFAYYRGFDVYSQFVTLQTFAFGFAIAGNAAEHFSKRGGPPPAP
jgi:hypothetical protein